jgi:hypothetical protein
MTQVGNYPVEDQDVLDHIKRQRQARLARLAKQVKKDKPVALSIGSKVMFQGQQMTVVEMLLTLESRNGIVPVVDVQAVKLA